MIQRFGRNAVARQWILLFIAIIALYLLIGALIVSDLNKEGKVIAKVIPTSIVLIAILKSKSLRGVLFHNFFLTGMTLIATILLVRWSVDQMEVFKISTSGEITLHLSRNLFTAIFEELLFRVVLFVGLLHFFSNPDWRFWKTTAITSLVFSALHFTNVLQPEYNLYGAFTLVIFAFGMGFFLQVIYVVTRNILVPVCIHFLVNFFGTSGQLNSTDQLISKGNNQDMTSLLFLIVFCAVLVGLAYLIYRKAAFDKYIATIE